MLYAMPGTEDALFTFKDRYENFIGGEWVAPLEGGYFQNVTPVTGEAFCDVPRSTPADLKKALDADRILPYYQGIYNNSTGVIDKYECLVRLVEDGKL